MEVGVVTQVGGVNTVVASGFCYALMYNYRTKPLRQKQKKEKMMATEFLSLMSTRGKGIVIILLLLLLL